MPSVEPIPSALPAELRFWVPEEAQDASYFAASGEDFEFAEQLHVPCMFMTGDSVNPIMIRPACAADEADSWAILKPVIRAGNVRAVVLWHGRVFRRRAVCPAPFPILIRGMWMP